VQDTAEADELRQSGNKLYGSGDYAGALVSGLHSGTCLLTGASRCRRSTSSSVHSVVVARVFGKNQSAGVRQWQAPAGEGATRGCTR